MRASAIMSNPNTDPHTFEASPRRRQGDHRAKLIVQNGAGYDDWATTVENAQPGDGREVINVQQLLGLPKNTSNPHLWYKPATMPVVAAAIAADLGKIDPAHAAYYRANAATSPPAWRRGTSAIAAFKSAHPDTPVATTEPVADYLLQAAGADNLTPWTFQADIMNGIDPSPQDVPRRVAVHPAQGQGVPLQPAGHRLADRVLHQAGERERHSRHRRLRDHAHPGLHYQTWMRAEVNALSKAVTDGVSTERL